MSGLAPPILRHAVDHVFIASASFGVVALALLVALMIDREVLRVGGVGRVRRVAFSVCSASLLAAVALTVAARLGVVVH